MASLPNENDQNSYRIVDRLNYASLEQHYQPHQLEEFQASAIDQLNLLGYKKGDKVCYRAIETNAAPRKLQATHPKIPAELVRLNQTHNIYIVVNSGGDKDRDITECRAIFYEHDDIPKAEQLLLWQALKLPEPTFQVDTGGKSIHSYWVLAAPIEPVKWKILQTDLLNFAHGDKSIKNPSRVMRLAGFSHQMTGETATIVTRSGKTYSYEKLRSIVPVAEIKPRVKVQSIGSGDLPPIPIERCLSRSHRDSLTGRSEGSRDNTAIAIARDLIGVAAVVPNLEFNYCGKHYRVDVEGDSYQIFCEFGRKCTPSLTEADLDRIWKSANSYAPSPAIEDLDALKNCLRSWAKACLPAAKSPTTGRKSKRAISADAIGLYESLAAKLGLELVINDDGEIESKLMQLTLKLFEKVGQNLRLNLMTRDYEYLGKQIDLNHAKFWIAATIGSSATTEDCILAIHQVGEKHSYHPVNEYLERVRTSTQPDFNVLENVATYFLGNSDPLANKMVMKKLVAAVARVKQPGCKDDTLLVLQGAQGAKKSTFLKVLAGADWFCDDIRDLDNKDELAKLSRNWMLELAEVDYLMGRKEVESFKRFLSTTTDTYRPPYGRANIRIDRTCAFFATTNKSEFLTDPTGDRRYWVVEVMGKIDCEQTAAYRDIIWATALAAYERGDTWWLDEADDSTRASDNFKYRDSDPWLDEIMGSGSDLPTIAHSTGEYIKVSQIFDRLNLSSIQRDRKSSNRVVKVLMELGFVSKVLWIDGKSQKVWYRESSVPNNSPLPSDKILSNAQNPATATLLPILPTLSNNIGSNIKREQIEVKAKDLDDICNSALPEKLGNESKRGKSVATTGIHDLPNSVQIGMVGEVGKELKIGDKVRYSGDDKACQRQYAGVLTILPAPEKTDITGEEIDNVEEKCENSTQPTQSAVDKDLNPTPPHTQPCTTLHKFTVGDRVMNEKVGRTGTIVEIRTRKTPKGTEYVQFRVDFGFDSCWFEDVVLQAHKTAV
jgi:hypothetical protein